MKPIVAITMGDPVGIGPEIIIKAFLSKALHAVCRPVVIGRIKWMEMGYNSVCGRTASEGSLSLRAVETIEECRFEQGTLEVLNRGSDLPDPVSLSWPYGTPHPQAAQAALSAIKEAARLALDREVSAIVTAPINKAALRTIGFAHPGHTEFLAELAGVAKFGMMMVGGGIKVMLTTIHIPLREVSVTIRKELLLEKIGLTHEALKSDFGLTHGRIAVASLNPHAGEDGLFGAEEREAILPAVLSAQASGIRVSGPYPADTLFFRLKEGQFDAALALYHDQALIPIKLLAFGRGVNVTVGLPFIRTSVDHGTAYDIAGKGIADSGSLMEAVSLAVQMVACRNARVVPFF